MFVFVTSENRAPQRTRLLASNVRTNKHILERQHFCQLNPKPQHVIWVGKWVRELHGMWHLCCVTAEESGPQAEHVLHFLQYFREYPAFSIEEAVVTAPATSEVIPVVSAAAKFSGKCVESTPEFFFSCLQRWLRPKTLC